MTHLIPRALRRIANMEMVALLPPLVLVCPHYPYVRNWHTRSDVLCPSITEQTTGKWNLFVLYIKYISNDLLGDFRGIKNYELTADVIHDLYKSSNAIGF